MSAMIDRCVLLLPLRQQIRPRQNRQMIDVLGEQGLGQALGELHIREERDAVIGRNSPDEVAVRLFVAA